MIAFTCAHCGQQYTVGPELAGRQGKCRRCGQRMQVPEPKPAAGPEPEKYELVVSDRLLPAEPDERLAGKPPTPEVGLPITDQEPEAEPEPLDEQPASSDDTPLELLEERADERPKKNKNDPRQPAMRGTDADVKIRGNTIVIRHHYDEPERIRVSGILKVDVSRPLFGSDGVIRFVISDPSSENHQLLDEGQDAIAVSFPASEFELVHLRPAGGPRRAARPRRRGQRRVRLRDGAAADPDGPRGQPRRRRPLRAGRGAVPDAVESVEIV